ncbi:hypothetical protein BKA65DRAFT_160028 [Rhexocercosporidium sp. MPI-PUGE-AT-0058]|nr:hypothetical protein BKA65DRAFT_160028 [Rhexocercosporidium sp. MPI-PUGE-AT-0058]
MQQHMMTCPAVRLRLRPRPGHARLACLRCRLSRSEDAGCEKRGKATNLLLFSSVSCISIFLFWGRGLNGWRSGIVSLCSAVKRYGILSFERMLWMLMSVFLLTLDGRRGGGG